MIPKRLCLGIHKLILRAVNRWDPQPHPDIKALPFGLCLKTGPRVSLNEGNALLLVEKHTTVPAPRLINVTVDNNEEDSRGMGYLLMTQVRGISIERALDRLTYEERHQIAKDLAECISQWRKIPNPHPHFLCDTLGGPLADHRMAGIEPGGPFDSMTEFLDFLTEDVEFARTEIPSISALYKKQYEACFTHSDLHPTNIITQQGRLSGIVDWEHASFKPEYWEYTRAVWPYPGDKRRAEEFRKAFDKDYEEELVAERKLWDLKPSF
jgi:aminoglycoside phosphotransferase (APT) family kinase protein